MIFRKYQLSIFILFVLTAGYLSFPSPMKMGMIYYSSFEFEKAKVIFDEVNRSKVKNIPVLKKLRDFYLMKSEGATSL